MRRLSYLYWKKVLLTVLIILLRLYWKKIITNVVLTVIKRSVEEVFKLRKQPAWVHLYSQKDLRPIAILKSKSALNTVGEKTGHTILKLVISRFEFKRMKKVLFVRSVLS